jgi:MFS family permease
MQATPQTSTGIQNAAAPGDDARKWSVMALLVTGIIIAYVARENFSVALADKNFKSIFNLTDANRGVLNSAFFWSYAFLQIPAGWIVDRYGVKWPYAISFLFWSVISAGTALAGTISQLYALRFLLGVGESVATPASLRWIRFHFGEHQRGLAIGLHMAGTKLGPAIGAWIAVRLLVSSGWQAMFIILGIGSLLWLIPWLFLAKDDDRKIEQAAQSRVTGKSVSFGKLMASPVIWGTMIGTFCYMYFVYYCMTWMPAYFVEQRGLSLKSMGWYTFLSFGGMAAVSTLAGWAADRIIVRGGDPVGVRKAFTIAGFIMASTEVIGASSHSVPVSLFFAVFSLSGLGLATANYWALTQTLIPGGAIGRIVGIQNCAANIPGIVAPILTGWLLKRTGSYEAPMQAIWFFLLLGIASYVFLVREKYAPKESLS